jgi:hypothetical protein
MTDVSDQFRKHFLAPGDLHANLNLLNDLPS